MVLVLVLQPWDCDNDDLMMASYLGTRLPLTGNRSRPKRPLVLLVTGW